MDETNPNAVVRVGIEQVARQFELPARLFGEVGERLYSALVPAMGTLGRVAEAMAATIEKVFNSQTFQMLAFHASDEPEFLSACLYIYAAESEWAEPLRSAYDAGDSLPWLVFADWCDENRPEWSRAARLVGSHLGGVA